MTRTIESELSSRIVELQREVRAAKMARMHAERVAQRSEALAAQSKRAMLRAYDELQQRVCDLDGAKSDAEEAALVKGRFMATMSHELRTPLNGMVGSADLLLTTPLRDDQRELVELLQRSGASLLAIVNDVLDYSRIEADSMPIERIPFRLDQCVHDVVELQRPVATDKSVELRSTLGVGLPSVVMGDPGRLRQVLMNLLTNALKFTAQGAVEIQIERGSKDDEIVFSVTDTGIGIREDAQEFLFDPYAQASSSTSREFGGTGLGLAVSKRLVGLMGGRIGVESTLGEGSTFTFTAMLPRGSEHAVERTIPLVNEPVATVEERGLVLVVDDNASNRLIVSRMLKQLGYTCDEAVDGVDAAGRAAVRNYCLVLMDCNMPVMDGFDATRVIRSLQDSKASVPILALTANSLPEDEALCRAAGMDDFLTKPLRLADLRAAIDRVHAQ